jgi:hypothetical protein
MAKFIVVKHIFPMFSDFSSSGTGFSIIFKIFKKTKVFLKFGVQTAEKLEKFIEIS